MTMTQCIETVRTLGTARQAQQVYRWAAYGRLLDARALAADLLASTRPALRVVA